MGQFDRKAGKKGQEPDAPKSQKVHKKKSSAKLDSLNTNHGGEKERNLKIFSMLQRKEEIRAAGGQAGKAAEAHTSEQKIIKKVKNKEKMRRKSS